MYIRLHVILLSLVNMYVSFQSISGFFSRKTETSKKSIFWKSFCFLRKMCCILENNVLNLYQDKKHEIPTKTRCMKNVSVMHFWKAFQNKHWNLALWDWTNVIEIKKQLKMYLWIFWRDTQNAFVNTK